MEQTLLTVEKVENVEVQMLNGFLPVGKEGPRQIESPIRTTEEASQLLERAQENLVTIPQKNRKCAVCIDGRCAVCTGAELDTNNQVPVEATKKVEVYAKLPGGLYHHATMMAIGANAALIRGAETYDEAFAIVSGFMASQGYEDGMHSTVDNYTAPNKTGCAARDQAEKSASQATDLERARRHGVAANPIADTLAIIYGAENANDLAESNTSFNAVQSNLETVFAEGRNFFAGYNSATQRDELFKSSPDKVELLESDNNHPTHLHVEEAILVNMVDGTTLDRDSMEGKLFCYDRWMADEIALVMAGTAEEQERLLMASDIITVGLAHEITAPGMPVGVTQKQHALVV